MSNNTNVQAALAELSGDELVESDKQFNASSPKAKHETAYTQILDAYAENIEQTLKKKRCYKTLIFWLAFALLAGVFVLLVGLLIVLVWKKPLTGVAEWCSIVIPALVSFLTVFFVIPKVITEYLFNSEEEKYMSEIIKNIQNYDKENQTESRKESS